MFCHSRKKYETCSICGILVVDFRGGYCSNLPNESELLKKLRELNFNVVQVADQRLVACTACRHEVRVAYKFAKKCRMLGTPPPLTAPKQLQDAYTQTEFADPAPAPAVSNMELVPSGGAHNIPYWGPLVSNHSNGSPSTPGNLSRVTVSDHAKALLALHGTEGSQLSSNGGPMAMLRLSRQRAPTSYGDICSSKIFLYIDNVEDHDEIGKIRQVRNELMAHDMKNAEEYSDTGDNQELHTLGSLKTILKDCGDLIKRIKLCIYDYPIIRLRLISDYCNNIENLQLQLSCRDEPQLFQDEIVTIFQRSKQIRRLYMHEISKGFDYSSLEYLSNDILEIHLHTIDTTDAPFLELAQFPNLEALLLWNFDLIEDTLTGLEELVHLEYLALNGSYLHMTNVLRIVNFTKLKHLAIPYSGVDDQFLFQVIHNNSYLEYLDVSGSISVTDRSLQYVTHLANLKTLYARNLVRVTGTYLMDVLTLQELDIQGCTSIVDWVLLKCIERIPNLRRLYAMGVATWDLLINAQETLEMGHRGRQLHIYVDPALASRWFEVGAHGKRIWVFTRTMPRKKDGNKWPGWHKSM